MKKILFTLVAGFITALVATEGAKAQNKVNTEALEPQKTEVAIENGATPATEGALPMNAVSSKAIKEFAKTHKNVTGESWEKIKDGFTAKFTQNGVRNIVYYGTNGKWAGSLKGYFEEKMPKDIRAIVKRQYYDYSITYVQEVETTDSQNGPTYIVHLEDSTSIKLVKINDGQMDVYQEFKKQS